MNFKATLSVLAVGLGTLIAASSANALVLNGRPDLLSAWILLDAAKHIEESYSSPMHSA